MTHGANLSPQAFGVRAVLAVMLLLNLSGCTSWKDAASETLELPTARMFPDSVGLEITFVRVPLGHAEVNQQLWQQIDEQILDATQRRHLSNNGIRCGMVGNQLPDVLRELLRKQEETQQIDQAVTTELDVLAQNQRVQRRSGQRFEVVTGAPRSELIVLYVDPHASKVAGKPYSDAQCILAARPFPESDGRVRLELVPEIHHGAPRNTWVPGQGTFQLLAGRERLVYQDLAIQTDLHAGQTLVVSCTAEPKGLGDNFFVETGKGDAQQKLLLIRLIQVQRDELFERAAP